MTGGRNERTITEPMNIRKEGTARRGEGFKYKPKGARGEDVRQTESTTKKEKRKKTHSGVGCTEKKRKETFKSKCGKRTWEKR